MRRAVFCQSSNLDDLMHFHRSESIKTYVLLTAAHNEEAFIEKTIASVLAQTVLPLRWVIVSDGSTDKTAEIEERYGSQY